jgi:predicted ATPase/DNA-binding CsgD family transcriptional regulator
MRAGGQTKRELERHSGLPAEVSSLVGRGPQIAAVLEGLRTARVVTLTGPGGCGKTRLALRAATLAADRFGDGARLVELASLTDSALVPAAIAEALGVAERDAANPMTGVVQALADCELLIVLDNCEHVLGSAGQAVVMLAGRCRRVRILATSRERLDVPGEFVFPVPPLGLPEDGSVRAVVASEAGGLLVARARAASPTFALTAGNSAAIAEVCSRLDGMPLAIELAAARCPTLGPAQLAARLEGHPGLLSGGAARPGRHRSLEAVVSWSYELLDEAERRLLGRLSVLRGGFDLEVAERVAGGEPLAPEAVAGLLANLLAGLAWHAGDADRVVAEVRASQGLSGQADPALAARAQVLLANASFLSGDLAEQERHALLAVELARTAAGQEGLPLALTVWSGPAIAGAGIQPATVAAVDEAANLMAAHPDRFTETILRCWQAQMFAALGQLDAAETEVGLCWAAGRSGAARLVEIIGPVAEARLAAAQGDTAAAIGALRRSADGARRVGIVMFLPATLASLACMAAIAGDESTAAAVVGETCAELGRRRQAITAAALGYAEGIIAWHRGELADAERRVREATLQWHRGSDRMDACDGIELLGVLAAARERYADAARLLAAADAARQPLQYLAPGFTANRDAAAHAASQARNVLGDDRFTQAQKEGQGLTLDDAVAYATRKGGGRKRPATGWASLTPAELEVVRVVGEGLRNDAIARRLFIAPATVKVHLAHIFAKLGITTRAELAAQAASRNLTAR